MTEIIPSNQGRVSFSSFTNGSAQPTFEDWLSYLLETSVPPVVVEGPASSLLALPVPPTAPVRPPLPPVEASVPVFELPDMDDAVDELLFELNENSDTQIEIEPETPVEVEVDDIADSDDLFSELGIGSIDLEESDHNDEVLSEDDFASLIGEVETADDSSSDIVDEIFGEESFVSPEVEPTEEYVASEEPSVFDDIFETTETDAYSFSIQQGASSEDVSAAIESSRILNDDPQVREYVENVFSGINPDFVPDAGLQAKLSLFDRKLREQMDNRAITSHETDEAMDAFFDLDDQSSDKEKAFFDMPPPPVAPTDDEPKKSSRFFGRKSK